MPMDGSLILHAVDFRGLRPLGQPLGSFLHLYVLGPGERRQHDVFRRVLLIGLQISFVLSCSSTRLLEWAILVVSRSTTGVSNSSERA